MPVCEGFWLIVLTIFLLFLTNFDSPEVIFHFSKMTRISNLSKKELELYKNRHFGAILGQIPPNFWPKIVYP